METTALVEDWFQKETGTIHIQEAERQSIGKRGEQMVRACERLILALSVGGTY